MASLTTYKDANTPEVTAWSYNNRNFMTAKTYADGKSVNYTYDADGKLLTRLWARGVTTTYSYDNAGRRTGIAYDDNLTPGIAFTYDFLNRLTSVTDGTGSRSFTYNTDSTLATESIPHIVNGSLEYAYDSYGRRTEMQLNQNSTVVFANNYTYDVQGRIATVSDGTNTATYSRIAGTDLLNTTTIAAGGNTKLTTTRNYDSLYRMTGISSTVGSVTKSYSYTYDAKDQRTRLDMADGSYWLYSYDGLGQVVSGTKYDSSGIAVPGQSFGYSYDDIGNLVSVENGLPELKINYSSNLVNEYTARQYPGVIPVLGEADIDAEVKVVRNDTAQFYAQRVMMPARTGKYYRGVLNVNNALSDKTVDYSVYATRTDPNDATKKLYQKEDGSFTAPKHDQSITYDDDGNMFNDGNWAFTWNGENRLLAIANPSHAKVEAEYDCSGRRVSKKTYSWVNSAWQLDKHLKFAYYGFKLIAEYDGVTGDVLRRYFWSGDKLEWMMNGSSVYYYVIDGNKNVTALVDSSGNIAAEYSYDPFGKITAQSGAMADINPFRFSSEYYDLETGLVYYNFRYYSPDLRRWLNRDPMGEFGSSNLYAMVNNNAANKCDWLGLMEEPEFPMSYEDYFQYWKSNHTGLSEEQYQWVRENLAHGCIGVVMVELGQKYNEYPGYDARANKPRMDRCFNSLKRAKEESEKLKSCCQNNGKPRIFGIKLPADSGVIANADGSMDFSNWYPFNKIMNYDFGILDPKDENYVIHASNAHKPPKSPMFVKRTLIDEWGFSNLPLEVWCTACDGGNYKNPPPRGKSLKVNNLKYVE